MKRTYCSLILGAALISALPAANTTYSEERIRPYTPADSLDARPDTTRYHSYNRMRREIDSLVGRYPGLVKLETLTVTTTGRRAVLAVKIANNARVREDEPAVLFNGAQHSCEFIGTEICLKIMGSLLSNYTQPAVKRLVDSLQIYFVPMVNPDGQAVDFSGQDTWWRKNTRDNNRNGRFDSKDGVDLNRNYPFNWTMGGSTSPSSREYRGPSAGSESEVQALMRLTARERFVLDACYHSSQDNTESELLYYPWSWNGVYSADHAYIYPVASGLAKSISRYDGTGTYQAGYGYATSGGMYRNWSYNNYGVFSFTVEVGHGYYPNTKVDSLSRINVAGAYYLLNRALSTGLTGRVLDSLTGRPLAAQVILVGVDSNNAHPVMPRRADSTYGRFRRLLNAGSYTLRVSCPGYRTRTIGPVVVTTGSAAVADVVLARTGFDGPLAVEEGPVSQLTLNAAPNPFVDDALIRYGVARAGKVELKLFDVRGRLIAVLAGGQRPAGTHTVSLGAARLAAKGVYLLRLESEGLSTTQKLIRR